LEKDFFNEYLCFTRWKMRGDVAEVHSEANKYDVTHYVKMCIVSWIGERLSEANKTKEDFGEVVGKAFNKLKDEVVKEKKELIKSKQGENI